MRREAEEGNPGRVTKDLPRQQPGLDADGGELSDCRLRNHAAIGEEKHPVVTVLAEWHLHDHCPRNHRCMGKRLDQLEQGAEERGRIGSNPTDQTVDEPMLEHHAGEIIRSGQEITEIARLQSLIPLKLGGQDQEPGHLRGGLRVDDRDAVHGNAVRPGNITDFLALSDQNGDP